MSLPALTTAMPTIAKHLGQAKDPVLTPYRQINADPDPRSHQVPLTQDVLPYPLRRDFSTALRASPLQVITQFS